MIHPRHLTIDRLLAAGAFVLVAALALAMPVQSDTWWHLAAGRDMLETGRLALSDTWSHTAHGRPWFNHAWGTEILAYLLVRWGGLPLLTLACASLVVAAYALAWSLMRGPLEARSLLLVLVTIDATGTWAPRGQLVTMVLVVLTVHLVLARRWWWLPPLFVAWANLHGGVALGGALLVVALLCALAVERSRVQPLILAGLACACAGALTPFGWRYWPELAASVGRITANRPIEWQPPSVAGPHLLFWIALATLPVACAVRWRRLHSFDTLFPAAAGLLAGVFAASAQRNVPIFLLIAVPAMTRLAWTARPSATNPETPIEPWRAVLHGAILVTAAAATLLLVADTWGRRPAALGWTPVSATAAAAIRACQTPIYNVYNDGAALAWFVPGQPVFIDSRQDPYPVALVRAHVRAEQTQDYTGLFRDHGMRCAVFAAGSTGPVTLARAGWHERFRDARWVVLDPP